MLDPYTLVIYGFVFALPAVYLAYRHLISPSPIAVQRPQVNDPKPQRTIMQPPRNDLLPPKSDPFTIEELRKYDGRDLNLPIYVAIKGTVYDVTNKRDVYGPGKSYGIFAGKDASRAFGMSSLKAEDAVADYSTLDDKERKVLDDWYSFFEKRYNIVGKVVDIPPFASSL